MKQPNTIKHSKTIKPDSLDLSETEMALHQSKGFFEVSVELNKKMAEMKNTNKWDYTKFSRLINSSAILTGLALEIILKVALDMTTDEKGWGHNHVKIFDKLPSTFQSKLQELYTHGLSADGRQIDNPNLRQLLEITSNLFVEYRYSYEFDTHTPFLIKDSHIAYRSIHVALTVV